MTLENYSHIAGIAGLLAIIITFILGYRKKLLSTGFTMFKDHYNSFQNEIRAEMADFKTTVRDYINQNDERHTRTLERITEIFEQTQKSINKQTNVCKMVQVRKEGTLKREQDWKDRIENEIKDIYIDVEHIKDKINHEKKD